MTISLFNHVKNNDIVGIIILFIIDFCLFILNNFINIIITFPSCDNAINIICVDSSYLCFILKKINYSSS